MLPPDLAGRVQALQNYDFMDDAARQRFEELMDELRQQLMQSYFNQMSEGMQDVSPERWQRMKDMLVRAQPHARAARARRGARLRGLHGALRRLLPRQPEDARRAARADGALDGRDAADAELDDARAAGAAPGSRAVAARGPRPALAGRRARPQPAAGLPRHAVEPVDELLRRRPVAVRADAGPARDARRPRPAREPAAHGDAAGPARRGRHRPAPATCSARTPPAALERLQELAKMLEDAGLIEQREGRLRAHAQGRPGARPEGARRPVPQAAEGQGRAGTRSSAPVSATSGPTSTSPTSSATRSTSTSRRRSRTRSGARGPARRCGSHRRTSRSSAPRCSPVRPRC